MPQPPVLIENWLPIAEIGVESRRERGASSALPPLYFLHVWWARRPLIASRAAVLGSVLPQWSANWPQYLLELFPNENSYRKWFINFLGITGDPIKGQKIIDWAKSKGIRLKDHPFKGAPRAFTVNPNLDNLKIFNQLLEQNWGKENIKILDPFSGGGSIPLEALRYGFDTIANELNPVAATILLATLEYPLQFGMDLVDEIQKWGTRWSNMIDERLSVFFPKNINENIFAYLWARTVQWNGRTVPLSPNWWLSKDPPVAVRVIADEAAAEPRFEILRGQALRGYDPDNGTVSRGSGRCPWTNEVIDGDYIKSEAQAGRMGQVLYAVALKKRGGFEFRPPTPEDLQAVRNAENALAQKRPQWLNRNLIPTEEFPEGNDNRPINYGMPTWEDFFSPRQLYSTCTFLETLLDMHADIFYGLGEEKGKAVITLLSFAIDKCAAYNCRNSRWHSSRTVMAPQFERHDFSFKWSFGEFDASANLLTWAISQIIDAYDALTDLINPQQYAVGPQGNPRSNQLTIRLGSAANLAEIPDGSLHNITLDPPYYDNVQYAELSDFFYVWLKRSLGNVHPHFFRSELTDKDEEAVANPARFAALGSRKKALAEQDYENKMTACFTELQRVLHPDGVMTVMFTHKKVEAWDTLAMALINAGFVIKTSWPVHTESEHSLHQARKNAAASTILLVCRKRQPGKGAQPVWWEDIQGQVRRTAREKAQEFILSGISGVDLYLSVFGPTLSIISQNWPVLTSEVDAKSGQPRTLRPDTALTIAREEVLRLRKQGLLLGRDVRFDPCTDWYMMAWDAFQAVEFPYDEARKLAIALGVDLDQEIMQSKKLAVKKGSSIALQSPQERRRRGQVDAEAENFEHWIDAVHTVMVIFAEDGSAACDAFLMQRGLKRNHTFKELLQALINAIPRTRIGERFVRSEAEILENMRLAFFEDVQAPVETEPALPQATQMTLDGVDSSPNEPEDEDLEQDEQVE